MLQILPVDMFNTIADYLPINDLLSLAITTKGNRILVNNYLKRIFENKSLVDTFTQYKHIINNLLGTIKIMQQHIYYLKNQVSSNVPTEPYR